MDPHRLAEERSLAYHRVIAARIVREPALLERARVKVAAWLAEGGSAFYARAWERVLSAPAETIAAQLVADTEEARALRQATPFAGALEPRERWRIWREVRERYGASHAPTHARSPRRQATCVPSSLTTHPRWSA
jgi:hypothetical protein